MASITSLTPQANLGQTLLSPIRAIASAMDWVRACNRMSSDYTRLSHMSDSRLAQMGLKRTEIAEAVRKNAGLF